MKRSLWALAFAFAMAPGLAEASQTISLEATIRDSQADFKEFEGQITGLQTGLVASNLGADRKPVYVGAGGGTVASGAIQSAGSFHQWYTDTPGRNINIASTLTLTETAPGSGIYASNNYPAFFPIDNQGFGNEGRSHNYHFTLESHSQFTYEPGQTLSLLSDDDAWVFINNKLAIDLGGVHAAESGSVNLDALGLTAGNAYNFDFFYNERHTIQSGFNLQTNIVLQSIVVPEPAAWGPGALAFGLGAIGLRRRARRAGA